MNKLYCAECGDIIETLDAGLCDDCYIKTYYEPCEHCGELVDTNEAQTTHDGFICDDCIERSL